MNTMTIITMIDNIFVIDCMLYAYVIYTIMDEEKLHETHTFRTYKAY